MSEPITSTYRLSVLTRHKRKRVSWLLERLLIVLGIQHELIQLRQENRSLQLALEQANEALREISVPKLPMEFFDDTEILVTEVPR